MKNSHFFLWGYMKILKITINYWRETDFEKILKNKKNKSIK
jgi:hypothetical protein